MNKWKRIYAVLMAITVAAVGAISFAIAPQAQAATARNGICEQGEFCYYYRLNYVGSVSDFPAGLLTLTNYGTSQPSCYEFKGPGDGKGQCIYRNAASAWNRTNQTITITSNNGYSWSIGPGNSTQDLGSLRNNNTGHRASGGSPQQTVAPKVPTGQPYLCTDVTKPVSEYDTIVFYANGTQFQVHKCMAEVLKRMINDAANVKPIGIVLKANASYRTREEQVLLRKKYCLDNKAAEKSGARKVYQESLNLGPLPDWESWVINFMPQNYCSPETAIPGTSMHERGLAVDFLDLSQAGFAWLQGNAPNYGFFNLPSERWHWSTNGK